MPPAADALAAAIIPYTTGLTTEVQDVFDLDRAVPGYSGNAARWSKGGSTLDVGFDSNGAHDWETLRTFIGSGTATLVKLYSQKSTGKEVIPAGGTITCHNVLDAYRFGTDWSDTTGLLSRSSIGGGLALKISGGAYLELTSSGLTANNGLEIHLRCSPNNRKLRSGVTGDPYSPSTTAETLVSYGLSATNYFQYSITTSSTVTHQVIRNGSGAGGTSQTLTADNGLTRINRNQTRVLGIVMDGTNCERWEGFRTQQTALSAGNVTANATFSNGTLRIGQSYSGTTSQPADMLFGGVVITNTLTTAQRRALYALMSLTCHQHLALDLPEMLGWYGYGNDTYNGEIFDFNDADSGTGLVTGRCGRSSLTVNRSGSPTWQFARTEPRTGQVGLYGPADNTDNWIEANDNWGTHITSGSLFFSGFNDEASVGLRDYFNFGYISGAGVGARYVTMGLGKDHSPPRMLLRVHYLYDPNEFTYSGGYGDSGSFSQPTGGKYLNKTTTLVATTIPKTTTSDITVTRKDTTSDTANARISTFIPLASSIGLNSGTYNYNDISGGTVLPQTPQELNNPTWGQSQELNSIAPVTLVGTFQRGANYNESDPLGRRERYMRTGTNWLYMSDGIHPPGHVDGSIGRQLGNGNVVHHHPQSKLQAGKWASSTATGTAQLGTHRFWALTNKVLSAREAAILTLNMPKLEIFGYPPRNTVAPVVSGVDVVGETLTCTTGTWLGTATITYAYQWLRDGSAISGATASTYVLQAADVGALVACRVTATNGAGTVSKTSGNSLGPVTLVGIVPSFSVAPVISGEAVETAVLTSTTGAYAGTSPITLTYQWKRNGSNISGATSATYTLQAADATANITLTVTATNAYGNANSPSNSIGPITLGVVPANTVLPVITGTTKLGYTLSCSTGTWNGAPTPTFTYQWKRGGVDITSATNATYDLVGGDENTVITCAVTGTNALGNSTATSAGTSAITSSMYQDIKNLGVTGSMPLFSYYGWLNHLYKGPVIRVERSSDAAQQDFTPNTITGLVDHNEILNFVGTGATDQGYVVSVYDQNPEIVVDEGASGGYTPKNANFTSAATRPMVVKNGALVTYNGRTCIQGSDGTTSKGLRFAASLFDANGNVPYTMVTRAAYNGSTATRTFFIMGASGTGGVTNGFSASTKVTRSTWNSVNLDTPAMTGAATQWTYQGSAHDAAGTTRYVRRHIVEAAEASAGSVTMNVSTSNAQRHWMNNDVFTSTQESYFTSLVFANGFVTKANMDTVLTNWGSYL